MALKLDMAKAYDRMEWKFLRSALNGMDFPTSFIELIIRCVTTVSYFVIINGEAGPSFSPQRGLRQGDPLSPIYFIICAEVFSCLLSKANFEGRLHGVKVGRQSPDISHLFFCG